MLHVAVPAYLAALDAFGRRRSEALARKRRHLFRRCPTRLREYHECRSTLIVLVLMLMLIMMLMLMLITIRVATLALVLTALRIAIPQATAVLTHPAPSAAGVLSPGADVCRPPGRPQAQRARLWRR